MSSTMSIDAKQYFGLTPAKPKAELGLDTFMRLLTVQLANQNPLEPMNDRDFFAQMAQLGTVQGMDELNNSITMGQASTMIGMTVTATRPTSSEAANSGELFTGVVRQVTNKDGEYVLTVEEPSGAMVEVKMENVIDLYQAPDAKYFVDDSQAILLMGRNIRAEKLVSDGAGGTKTEVIEGVVKRMSIVNGQRVLWVDRSDDASNELVQISVQDITAVDAEIVGTGDAGKDKDEEGSNLLR